MEQTEWRLPDQPLGWLAYLSPFPFVATIVINLVKTPPDTARFWLGVVVIVALVAVGCWAARRLRVRLTAAGVEVRRFRTKVYRWPDIASVQVAPAWERSAVWLRTRDMHPEAYPAILPLPLGSGRRPSDLTVPNAVASIARRIEPLGSGT